MSGENKDEEDLELENSVEFWRMIEEARRSPTVPLQEAEKELFPENEM
jgi:hypothetical protein